MRGIISYVRDIVNQPVRKIGQGEFSIAYRGIEDTSIVYLVNRADKSNDKEVLKLAYDSDNNHMPFMAYVGEFTHYGVDYTIFETRYSARVTKKVAPKAYDAATKLAKEWNQNFAWRFAQTANDDLHTICYDFIEYLQGSMMVDGAIIEALDKIYTWASAYGGNFFFEFPMRNLGVNDNGDLILRDILFFREKSRRNRW